MAGGGSANGSSKGIRIVVAGDRGTGKSSLIVTAAAGTFSTNVPPVLQLTRLPDDMYPEKVPITIIDTSSRYALGRLVGMNYQARMGMMAAGAYGLPQFRRRMFMWVAHHTEKLPQYPLPTHSVVVRGNSPTEFESNAGAYDEDHVVELENKLFLGDAISDLPTVENDEARDAMPYGSEPKTEFQRFIRLRKEGNR